MPDHVNKVTLTNVAYVPSTGYNLFSLTHLTKANGSFDGKDTQLVMRYPDGSTMGIGRKVDHLYHLSTQDTLQDIAMVANQTNQSLRDWHRFLGHINENSIRRLATDEGIKISNSLSHLPLLACIPCIKGKQHRAPLPTSSSANYSSIKPRNLASINIWGSAHTQSIGRYVYLCKIVDFATRWDFSQPLRTKDEICRVIYQYRKQMEKITGNTLNSICVDNTKELVDSSEFRA